MQLGLRISLPRVKATVSRYFSSLVFSSLNNFVGPNGQAWEGSNPNEYLELNCVVNYATVYIRYQGVDWDISFQTLITKDWEIKIILSPFSECFS